MLWKRPALPGPQVLAIRTFVFENFFEESELIDPTCSQPLTSEQVDRELAKTRKEVEEGVNEEIEKLEEEVQPKRKEKRIVMIRDEDEEVDYANNSNEESSEKGLTDSKEEKMTFDETYDRKNDWFISNLPKSTVLVILYIVKDLLTSHPMKEPTKGEFY